MLRALTVAPLLTGSGAVPANQNDPRLDALFDQLKAARDAGEGARIGRRVGAIYLRRGRFEEALLAFEQALRINPHLSGTRRAADALGRRLGVEGSR